MLPISKRNNDEIDEIEDADIIDVDPVVQPFPRRPSMTGPVSRKSISDAIVDDVAGECIASIAEVTSRTRVPLSVTAATIPPPPPFPTRGRATGEDRIDVDVDLDAFARAQIDDLLDTGVRPPASSGRSSTHGATPASSGRSSTRLPVVTAPPFVRTTPIPVTRSEPPSSVVPRQSNPFLAADPIEGSPFVRQHREKNLSVAPVTVTSPMSLPAPASTLAVSKAAWVTGAAVVGALAAVLIMRMAGPTSAENPPAVAVADAPVAAPLAAPLASAPPAPADRIETSPTSAIVRFADHQGIAIKAGPASGGADHGPTASAKVGGGVPSSRPKVAAPPPKLPDGSYGLVRSDTPPVAKEPVVSKDPTPATVPPAAAPAAPTPSPPKRALTPEQQLAEAQLKASMR